MRPDVIVTGTGRSGTSTVARILHTRFDVCMGHTFRDPSEASPRGEWEDTAVAVESRRMVGGFPFPSLSRSGPLIVEKWQRAFDTTHKRCKSELKGVKSPHLSVLDADGWRALNPRLIVKTWRPRELVAASMARWRGRHTELWGQFYDLREARMATALGESGVPWVEIRFTYVTMHDDVIAEHLHNAVQWLAEVRNEPASRER